MTAIAIPKKALQPAATRCEDGSTTPAWDLYLDGAVVASEYISQIAARMELDLAAWYALFGEAPLSPDIPITDEALDLALDVFSRLLTTEKVQEKGRVALENIIRPEIYTIKADGSLSVLASSGKGKQTSYTVRAHTSLRDGGGQDIQTTYHVTMECECKDFYTRAHVHGGVCKHVAARLLLFLAQLGVAYLKHLQDALDACEAPSTSVIATTTTPAGPDADHEDGMAFLSITASDLAAALFLTARATTPIELHAENGALHLAGGGIQLTLSCLDGHGSAAVRLEPSTVIALYDQVRPAASSIGAITVFVEGAGGSVYLCGQDETFSAEARGVAIPRAATYQSCACHA